MSNATTTAYRTLDDIDPRGKRVLVRLDLNVPFRDGQVTDTTRIDRAVPTLRALMDRSARLILMSHFGRPKGRPVAEMSLRPIAGIVSNALGTPVSFAEDCVGPAAEQAVSSLADGQVLLLENLRFHAGEEANEPAFADALAALGDLYVNDAFSAAHRAHASTEAIAHRLPSVAGRAMQAELEALGAALDAPDRPVAAVVGGAKVSTKLAVLGHLVDRVDTLIIGGGMANTFLHAGGISVGASLCEKDLTDTAREVMARAKSSGCEIVLPVDAVIAAALDDNVDTATVAIDAVPADAMILDVGPKTVASIEARFAASKTLLWNGPLGAFEVAPFDAATNAAAQAAAQRTLAGNLISVAGGGDTVAALAHAGVADAFTYVSTAGGAFLEWLEGKDLPGVAALRRAA